MAQIIALSPIFERRPAAVKKFREVVVIVHHYGGDKHSFSRHVDWLNELGYDVITFDLPVRSLSHIARSLPFNKNWDFGLRHVWADKIETVLGHLPEEKIIFSFSFSSAAALMAIGQRHAIDVKGWICEGGPFLQVDTGIFNLFSNEDLSPAFLKRISNMKIKKYFAKFAAAAIGGFGYEKNGKSQLNYLPENFPILSIRSEKDELVKPQMIDQFFNGRSQNQNFAKLELSHAGHLLGLKQEPDIYKNRVQEFLMSVSQR